MRFFKIEIFKLKLLSLEPILFVLIQTLRMNRQGLKVYNFGVKAYLTEKFTGKITGFFSKNGFSYFRHTLIVNQTVPLESG